MFYKLLSLLLGLSLCSPAFSQESFQIKGFVLDANTVKPIEGATVTVEKNFSISSKTGEFVLKNISKRDVSITVSHIGYTSAIVTFNANTELNEIKILVKPI